MTRGIRSFIKREGVNFKPKILIQRMVAFEQSMLQQPSKAVERRRSVNMAPVGRVPIGVRGRRRRQSVVFIGLVPNLEAPWKPVTPQSQPPSSALPAPIVHVEAIAPAAPAPAPAP